MRLATVTDEREARRALVETASRLWRRGLVAGSSGNLSQLLPDGDLVVTPSGRSLEDLAPDDCVRVSLDGTPRATGARPSSELPLHLAAYRVRPDARCVVHTHPTHCIVWASRGLPLPDRTVGARESLGPTAWTPYRPPGTEVLAQICAAQLAEGYDIVLLERHGLCVVAPDLETAFLRTDLAEQTARIAVLEALLEAAGGGKAATAPRRRRRSS
jgi:ribulose-5-phosphate 4-epimerase/fuculose-1-phosphate aldolase